MRDKDGSVEQRTSELAGRQGQGTGLSRRQLLAAGAGAAGVAAGAGLISSGAGSAEAASPAMSRRDVTVAAFKGTMTVQGAAQGMFAGDQHGSHVMAINAYGINQNVPYDPSSGLTTTSRQWAPVVITKPVGPASPQLMHAANIQEGLSTVQISFYRQKSQQGQLKAYYVVTLSDALVVNITQYVSDSDASHLGAFGLNFFEDVTFTFQSIRMEDMDAKTIFQDTWQLNT